MLVKMNISSVGDVHATPYFTGRTDLRKFMGQGQGEPLTLNPSPCLPRVRPRNETIDGVDEALSCHTFIARRRTTTPWEGWSFLATAAVEVL
jgi:hypothetical protein